MNRQRSRERERETDNVRDRGREGLYYDCRCFSFVSLIPSKRRFLFEVGSSEVGPFVTCHSILSFVTDVVSVGLPFLKVTSLASHTSLLRSSFSQSDVIYITDVISLGKV